MRNFKFLRRKLLGLTVLAAGGSMFANNCINTVASLPICGAVLTFCTPNDQIRVLYPLLETPDFSSDPSCTIPLGCGEGDDNFFGGGGIGGVGGDAPDEPADDQGGGLGGGGGGGAGGGGGGAGGGI